MIPAHVFSAGRRWLRFALLIALSAILPAAPAAADVEPSVPPGFSEVSGVMVALLGRGVDYRDAVLKERLARDGEGDLISWDMSDNDSAPFAIGPASATGLAKAISDAAPAAQLIIVKEQIGDPLAFGHMMTFVANTPAKIIVWRDAAPQRPDWPILAQAIDRFKERLFLVPVTAGANGKIDWPAYATIRAANTLILTAAGSAVEARRQRPSVDLSIGVAPDRNLTGADLADDLVVWGTALAVRAIAEKPDQEITEMKRSLVQPRPEGIATERGFIALEDLNAAMLPPTRKP